jgi:tryptophanyl-tRNA synthetase
MSKSAHDPASRIQLTDTPDEIRNKVRKAVTDSIPGVTWDPASRPGVSNLLKILCACRSDRVGDGYGDEDWDMRTVSDAYTGGRGIKELKSDAVDAVVEMLKGPREAFERLRREERYLDEVALAGAERAREMGEVCMREVRKRVGLA